jgi:hypothetical protein
MRTPGFIASAPFSRTPRGGVDGRSVALLDAGPAVVPAQINLVPRRLGPSPGGPRLLWEDRPACPPGQRAVWVDRAEEYYRCYDERTGYPTWCRIPPFHGWECESTLRVVA